MGKRLRTNIKAAVFFWPRIWISSRVAPSGIFSNRDNTGKAELRENGTWTWRCHSVLPYQQRRFQGKCFVDHIRNSGQRIQYCGTNAHHQNGVAERSIRSVSNISRALIPHAAAHWPNRIDSTLLWMTVAHSVYLIYNNTPNQNRIMPQWYSYWQNDTTISRERLPNVGMSSVYPGPRASVGTETSSMATTIAARFLRGTEHNLLQQSSFGVKYNNWKHKSSVPHCVWWQILNSSHTWEGASPPTFWNALCLESS